MGESFGWPVAHSIGRWMYAGLQITFCFSDVDGRIAPVAVARVADLNN